MYGSTLLTEKQAKILEYIEQEIARIGCPPSYRDIAKHFGNTAVGTVQDHIQALIRKGFLHNHKPPHRGTGSPQRRARSLRPSHDSGSLHIPILGSVPAGNPIEAIEDRKGSLPIPHGWPSRWTTGELFALEVTGESMIHAGILDGDYVVVKKQTHANHGDIVVAMIDGEATVKTLDKKSGRLRLLPANPKFSALEIPPHAENVIQGVVVSVQRYF